MIRASRDLGEFRGWGHPCRAYTWLALAFLAHNIEELGGMGGWLAARDLPFLITGPQVSQAVVWLTLAGVAVMLIGRSLPMRGVQIVVAGVAGMMIANVASHVALSLITWTYMPGTGTAVALVLPAGLWLMRHLPVALRTRWVAGIIGAVLLPPVTWAALVLASGA